MKTKAIASENIKTDKLLLRTDLVDESYVPPSDVREKCALVRHRFSLVNMRTVVKKKVHAITHKYGLYCQKINDHLIEH